MNDNIIIINTRQHVYVHIYCIICYEQKSYTDFYFLPCTHCFCKTCLHLWFFTHRNNTCPICRYICVIERLNTFHDISETNVVNTYTYDTIGMLYSGICFLCFLFFFTVLLVFFFYIFLSK
jgi:hypothetical protein